MSICFLAAWLSCVDVWLEKEKDSCPLMEREDQEAFQNPVVFIPEL